MLRAPSCEAPRGEVRLGVFRSSARRGVPPLAAAQRVEYVWSDGAGKSPHYNSLRSKTRVLSRELPVGGSFPFLAFDGRDSDGLLQPVFSCPDPVRGGNSLLALCEVLTPAGAPHASNSRAQLRSLLDDRVSDAKPLFSFQQQWTAFTAAGRPLAWPDSGVPPPDGPFYCSVGPQNAFGRPLAEAHLDACIKAGLSVRGLNAEALPGAWDFQIGALGPLECADQVLVARWLLHRLGEEFGLVASLSPKPVAGDWSGAGMHVSLSTEQMRLSGGLSAIEEAIEKLAATHRAHIDVYGPGNEARLTGRHGTCDIAMFKAGVADRGCSICVPREVQQAGCGYLEDRRPAANADPYSVCAALLNTVLKS